MSIERAQVEAIVEQAIAEWNAQAPEDQQLARGPDTLLLGRESVLDSLGLVTMIFSLEKKIDAAFGQAIVIGSELMSAGAESPLRTVAGLTDYLTERLQSQ